MWGGGGEDKAYDEEKIEAALKKMVAQERESQLDDRKRSYHSMMANSVDVSPEEMEAYRIMKSRTDDPMKAIEKGKATVGYEYV